MILTDKQLDIINQHTLDCYPKEAVICITATDAIPLTNLATDNLEFKVKSDEFYALDGIALVHSHPTTLGQPNPRFGGAYADPRIPTELDMATQVAMDIPFGILACDGTEVSPILWFPDLDSSLTGHVFTPGVYDCYRVIRAYYWQEYGIHLNEHPRDYDWYITQPTLYMDHFASDGWYPITEDELEPGDALIIRLVGTKLTHAGVYLGDDLFIHHENDKLSIIENYSKWRPKVGLYLRHKDRPRKESCNQN